MSSTAAATQDVSPPVQPGADTKPAYPAASAVPTQSGPLGIQFDFNFGARVLWPEGYWRVRLSDADTGNVLFASENRAAMVASSKRWFVRFRPEGWDLGGGAVPVPVFTHGYEASGREVLVHFPIGTLGDTLAWFPHAARFAEDLGCRLICTISGLIIPLLRNAYPRIGFLTHEEVAEYGLAGRTYATYHLGLFFDDAACDWQPTDFRHVGLHRTAASIPGVGPAEAPPRLALPDDSAPFPNLTP